MSPSDSLPAPRLEPRFVICSECGGEGIWDVPTGGYDHNHGGLITETRRCSTCGGSGQVEEEPTPRSYDDLFSEHEAPCDMGAGCDEVGICFASAHGQPDRCGRAAIAKASGK